MVISAGQWRPLRLTQPSFRTANYTKKTQLVKGKELCFNYQVNHRSTDCKTLYHRQVRRKHHSTLNRKQDKTAQRHAHKSNNVKLENQVNAKFVLKNQLQFIPIVYSTTTMRFLAMQFLTIAVAVLMSWNAQLISQSVSPVDHLN